MIGITNAGCDSLSAAQQNTRLKAKFMNYFNRGIPLGDAATNAITLVKAIS